MNDIFCVINASISKLTFKCEIAKEALTILKVAHEGAYKVRSSHMQILTTRFENMRMKVLLNSM